MDTKTVSMNKWLVLTLLLPLSGYTQGVDQARTDLTFLASDSLKGRQPGTEEIDVAAAYIEAVYREYQLTPGNEDSYYQSFEIPENVSYQNPSTYLLLEANRIAVDEHTVRNGVINLGSNAQIYPVKFSANGSAEGSTVNARFGITAPEMDHDDYDSVDATGKIVVIDISSPDGIHPHSQYMKYHGLDYRIRNAKEHGAVGVIFVQTDPTSQPPKPTFKSAIPGELPAWFVGNKSTIESLTNEWSDDIRMSVDLRPTSVEGRNLIGYLDRGKPGTLIIGAHYDHLGYGGENSLYRGERAIHNGADDNASGTTGLLNLVRRSAEIAPDHNLLFIAFSGEERGLIGSDYYCDHPTMDLSEAVAMLNMDMIGRLEEGELLISGTGTASEWDQIIEEANQGRFSISTSEGGTGASDHTSFYQEDIPVLHFFTGTHEDYHKPSDDADRINYEGLVEVTDLIRDIANRIPDHLSFQKTSDPDNASTPRFNVTLGIIPDYIFGGPGVKVDGVTEGRPAAIAGLQTDDIILMIGEYPIADIYAYMKALGAFNPGDKTTVTVKRGEEELTYDLTF